MVGVSRDKASVRMLLMPMPSADGPALAKYRDVWTIICHYLHHRQPADLSTLSVTCSSIAGAARTIMFRSLIVGGPSSPFLVALSDAETSLGRKTLSYIHTLHLNTFSPGEPENIEQMVQSRLVSCLHHLPLLSVFSLECRYIIPPMLEALSQLASIRPIDFTLLGQAATFTQPPIIPKSTLKFSRLSFMKNFKAWSSRNTDTDAQVVENLIARSANTLVSLRVDDSHVDCLRVLANHVLELPHLHNLVVLPTYAELKGRFALHAGLAQLKALRADEPDSFIDVILSQYPSIQQLSLASPLFVPRCLPPSTVPVLPNLRKITSDSSTLALLVPGRPVTTVVLTAPWPMTRANAQLAELDEDDRAAIAWQDRRELEELANEEQAEVFRCAYALSHSTGPVRRLILPLVRPSSWHTKLAKQALAAFVEALPSTEYLTVQLDPMVRANGASPPSRLTDPPSQDVPFGFASLAQLPNLIHVYIIANGAFVQGNDVLETILVLQQSSCPQLRKVDFECGALRTFNAQKELTCKLEWKWCVREKGGKNGETLNCWRERGYLDEEEISGPMDIPLVEKAKVTLKQRLLILLKKWRSRGSEIAKEELDARSDEEKEVPPPYIA
jgi:hypothetical protein